MKSPCRTTATLDTQLVSSSSVQTTRQYRWGLPSIQTSSEDSTGASKRHSDSSDSRSPVDAPKIIIMGGPASGKGTQCEKIVSMYNVVHLSTGDMLREAVQKNPNKGYAVLAKQLMDKGELVPDDIIIQAVLDRISQPDCQERGWLLDGFPRTAAQANSLVKMGIVPDLFLFLDVPDAQLVQRVLGRRLDPITGKTYHVDFNPPPSSIASRLVRRFDDTREKVLHRLHHFHQHVREYFEDILVEVDGSRSPSEVANSVLKSIDRYCAVHGESDCRPKVNEHAYLSYAE